MPARTLPDPAHLFRWLIAPVILGAMTAAISALRHRTRCPSVPRMSDEWLQHLDRDRSGADLWR